MPFLDVTDVLSYPDFQTTFGVIRTATNVSNLGETVLTPQNYFVSGVVEPASTKELERLPEAERLSGTIRIFTTFRLSDGDETITADVVVWNGRQYTVKTVDDFSEFGRGYIDALASASSIQ